jgi:hypothetical protein
VDSAVANLISAVANSISKNTISSSDIDKGPIYDPTSTLAAAYDPDARIWPKNNAIISRLAAPLLQAQSAFDNFVRSEWNRDEDALSERLVAFLHEQLKKHEKDPDIQQWIRDKGLYGGLSVSEPYVRDREPEMGADIALVVQYQVKDILNHTWTYLLQAKKAKGDSNLTRWDIDRKQLEDLLFVTRAGFYLLYTPEMGTTGCYVVPAQTIESTLFAVDESRRREKPAKSIPYVAGKALGKSWSNFLVEDVFGAWSGEPNDELAKLARSGSIAPFVFQVTFRAESG